MVVLLLGGCGGGGSASKPLPGKGKPAVTLGTKNFTEQFVLGQLYKQALEREGYRVRLRNDIGPSEVVDRELRAGRIDMYPEYTGVVVQELANQKAPTASAEQTYELAKAWEEGRGFTMLAMTPFTNRDAMVVTVPYAEKYGLRSNGDLRRVGHFRFGGPAENVKRFQGLVGLRELYGLRNLTYVPLANGDRYAALDHHQVDVSTAFTTDGQLQRGGYVLLADPQGVYGFQNNAMVVSQRVLARMGPAFASTINAVSAQLTNLTMQRLNAAVDLDHQAPATVARQFLRATRMSG